ncbi:MAG: hypothetical protein ACRDGI_11290 [Candidatus Limnocylindrales bacterium]
MTTDEATLAIEQIVGLQTDETRGLLSETVERAFDGDIARLATFAATLMAALPGGTKLYLRGSAVQGESYVSHQPFDAGGPGSSDLDVVVCGSEVMALFSEDGFYLPGVNSRPLCDDRRDVAPFLDEARTRAQELAGRPVSVQAMAELFLDVRSVAQGTSYLAIGIVPG